MLKVKLTNANRRALHLDRQTLLDWQLGMAGRFHVWGERDAVTRLMREAEIAEADPSNDGNARRAFHCLALRCADALAGES